MNRRSDAEQRIAFAFEKAYPSSVGGAERYYWALARESARTRPVTYLTARSPAAAVWEAVDLVGVGAGSSSGLILPKAAFAAGLLWHLLRHGSRYAVVHCACFPHAAVIAAWLGLLPHRRTRLVVDWHELLPLATWRRRRGLLGLLGYVLQELAVRLGDRAVCFSQLHLRRLRRVREDAVLLPEFLPERGIPMRPGQERSNRIVFAGRLVPDKRPELVPLVLRELRRRDHSWKATVFGDGPSATTVRAVVDETHQADCIDLRGFADWEEVSSAMATSRVLLFPSAREGFGLVVLEATSHGLPVVLVAGEDNAATELIEPGRNGLVCARPDPEALADAVLSLTGDAEVHAHTRAWFEAAVRRFSVEVAVAAMDDLHGSLR